MTSPRTDCPYRWRNSFVGTFPLRNPGIVTCCPISASLDSTRSSMSAAGITIEYSRLKPSFLVSVTCINGTDRGQLWPNVECAQLSFEAWCGRRDSNPHRFLHVDLNHARLPIPPRPQKLVFIRAHRAALYKNTGRAGQAKHRIEEKKCRGRSRLADGKTFTIGIRERLER